jgi:ribonuclease D
VLKVFHACRQDMEIFHQKMATLPSPIFDTQVAAMVLGYGESIGYEGLVNKVLGKSLDKSSRFTDWSKRPLSDKQIDYAMGDVLHLRDIYRALKEKLDASGRAPWIAEEMEPLLEPRTYDVDPDEVWQRIRFRNTSPKYLAMLKAAARWRELTARGRNVPRGRIMKDETLAEVAHAKPANFADLQAIRGFYPTMNGAHYEPLFEALREVASLPSSEYPRLPDRPFFPPESEALADMLRLLLKACAAKERIVPRLIADKDDLEALAMGKRDHIHALDGWRMEIFGRSALQLLDGKIALKADSKNGITFIDIA